MIKLKYIFFLIKYKIILLNIFILFSFEISISNDINICICTIGKLENLYVREYISHYKKYGVDKIFIQDNNDINGERFENVIYNDIKNGFVEIINFRGILKAQIKAYQHCLNINYKKFDWLIFYDMDEFIYQPLNLITYFRKKLIFIFSKK